MKHSQSYHLQRLAQILVTPERFSNIEFIFPKRQVQRVSPNETLRLIQEPITVLEGDRLVFDHVANKVSVHRNT
jgi:hypothetical protein